MIASAVFTVSAKKPVYSVIGLLANFVCLAGMYLELQAEFLAVIQIVVYSGAILILFVFVIALLSSGVRPFDVGPDRAPRILIPASILAGLTLIAITATVVRTPSALAKVPVGTTGEANAFGSVGDFGVAGVIARRNPLIMLMSIELLFNAANLALVTYARVWANNAGHVFAFLVITVAAAEAAIGLAIVAVTFRRTPFVDVDEVSALRG